MSSGSAQDVAVEHFLRDIERRGKRLHCAVIGCEEQRPRGDMNLLYRKSRLDWRHKDQDGNKKSSSQKDPSSATVGKVRDLASFRRHFRMGFMTMPASQDLSPHSCASAMAPRSQSCHAVGAGDTGLENGEDYSDTQSQHGGRCPPAKPKRHPSTRLSSSSDPRAPHAPPDAPPPPPPTHPQAKHSEKKNAMKKSDSGDMSKKVPPLKPKRSPSTQLSFEPPTPCVPPLTTPIQGGEGQPQGDDEPVYIEMVGQVFTRETQTATPHPVTPVATTPDSDSDQSEAIYEEMKYPLPEDREGHKRLPLKHERLKSSKHHHSSSGTSAHLPRPSSSPSCSKHKATVSISHSSPLPSSTSSTPVPQPLSSSPHPPRAPTPYLLQGNKSETESTSKIPAPFPNLLQHRPPLLAFPQPAAASSGVGVQHKAASAKLGTISIQTSSSMTAPSSTSSSSTTLSSNLPVPLSGSKESKDRDRDSQLGPAPGLRARSHSTPLPPSSKSTSPYSHHHHHHPHPHHRPSHYHHYRKPERGDSPNPNTNNKNGSETFSKSIAQTQTQGSGKEGKSVSFCLKLDKAERDRDRERDKDRERDRDGHRDSHRDRDRDSDRERHRERDREAGFHFTSSQAENTTNNLSSQISASSATTSSSSSSSHSRPHSRSQLHRYHTPHGLPAYKPPSSDSPLLWTYPSVGFRRPPAYDSLRGGSHLPSLHHQGHGDVASKSSTVPGPVQGKAGFMPWDNSGFGDDGSYLPMQRKLSFSQGSRETEREKDEGRAWNGSADALLRIDKEDLGPGRRGGGGHSGIPVRFTGGRGLGHSESLAGMEGGSLGFRALPRGGLPLPCQTFPACRNGELGRLSRSSSTSGVRQVGGSDVQRQSSLPHREVLNQLHGLSQSSQTPCSPILSRQQQQLQLHQQQLQLQQQLQQLQQQHHLQLQFQHLAQLAQGQPPTTGCAATSAAQTQRDGKLLEVIERKRCLCKEIKAHRRPEKNLCKQDSMPILPSWRRTPEPRKTGTPPCQRPQAVVWDTAI
ncbi:neuronal tyrosine-phosphorylated phosphoinositide-3-kinase adapter 1-like [Oncorhynchus tshawytscha]|nr:neuronal tyrosine-phosphorylated phosphoinositide-3-kinase adapter 1-like [Oncorhynchus tshawytscha]